MYACRSTSSRLCRNYIPLIIRHRNVHSVLSMSCTPSCGLDQGQTPIPSILRSSSSSGFGPGGTCSYYLHHAHHTRYGSCGDAEGAVRCGHNVGACIPYTRGVEFVYFIVFSSLFCHFRMVLVVHTVPVCRAAVHISAPCVRCTRRAPLPL